MKKLILLLLAISLALCLFACSDKKDEESTEIPTQNGAESDNSLDKVGKLLDSGYKGLQLSITNDIYGFTLTSLYQITEDSISYEIEKLNTLPEDGSIGVVSPDYKHKVSGTAQIRDGKIVGDGGEVEDLPELGEIAPTFSFSGGCLEVLTDEDGHLVCKVTSPSSFLGANTNASDMSVEIYYTADAITSITLEYDLGNSHVKAVYNLIK